MRHHNSIFSDLMPEGYATTFLYAGDFNLIVALLMLMGIDIITGIMKGIKNRVLWSRKSLFGFGRKVLIMLIIVVANLIDYVLELGGVLVFATVIFYILNEVLSIIENASELGVPIPDVITEKLAVMRKTDDYEKYVDELKNTYIEDKVVDKYEKHDK